MNGMTCEPIILFNPKSEKVSFMHDRQSYVFEPGEKRLMGGVIADYALRFVNCGLKKYEPGADDDLVASTNIAYTRMPWRQLITLASERKLFKTGMNKEETVKALVNADEQGSGAVRNPPQ